MSDTCATEQKLHAVTEANKMLVAEVERLEQVIKDIYWESNDMQVHLICEKELEISNAR